MIRRVLAGALVLVLAACAQPAGANTILHGRVTDASYRPISNATVRVESTSWLGLFSETIGTARFSPEGDGFFDVSGLPGGQFRAIAAAPGYAPEVRMVDMQPPLPFTVEFTLKPASSSD